MNNHPSRDQPADDAADDELVRLVAARQATHLSRTHGTPIEVPVDLDPARTRHRCGAQRDAMTVALWALRRNGAHVPDAIDAAAQRCPTCGIDNLPIDVALVLLARAPGDRAGVRAALGDVLADWKRRPDQFTRARIEITIWRLEGALQAALTAAIAADGSGAQLPGFTGPAPEVDDDLAEAATVAADVAISQLVDRLADELGSMAGLP